MYYNILVLISKNKFMSTEELAVRDSSLPPPLPLTIEQNELRQREMMKEFDSIFTAMTKEGDVEVPWYELTVSKKTERLFSVVGKSIDVFLGFADRVTEHFSIKAGEDLIGIKQQDGTLEDSELFTRALERVLAHLKKAQGLLSENKKKDRVQRADRVLWILDHPE